MIGQRHLMALPALIAACAIMAMPPSRAAVLPDFSGGWISTPDRLHAVRFVDRRPGGWHHHVEAIAATSVYRIDISQAEDQVAIVFPHGEANGLTVPAFPLSGQPGETVRDFGTWWNKVTCSGRWDGATLRLTAARLTERWDVATPASLSSNETMWTSTYALTLDDSRQLLTIDTTMSDEKGSVEYRQVFRPAH